MTMIELAGLNMKNKPCKKATDVISYGDVKRGISLVVLADKIQLTTPKGCINLTTQNGKTFTGMFNSIKVQASVNELTAKIWHYGK